MWDVVFWIFVIVVLAAGGVAGLWYYQAATGDGERSSGLFGGRSEKRLAIVEQSNVDGRRKLVLIRRDNIEHLIMTGGPVDVVIETGIGDTTPSVVSDRLYSPKQSQASKNGAFERNRDSDHVSDEDRSISRPVYTRPPRAFGKAVGE